MRLSIWDHEGKEFTGKFIYDYARDHKNDIGQLKNVHFADFYNFVRCIPYIDDPNLFKRRYTELVARPKYLLQAAELDCKKKACLIGAYCECNNLPYILVACSERPNKEIHHVFPAVQLNPGSGIYWNCDATFPNMYIGQPKSMITKAEILPK